MTPEQLQAYRDALKAGKFDPQKATYYDPIQRGFNEGIEFAEAQIKKVLAE